MSAVGAGYEWHVTALAGRGGMGGTGMLVGGVLHRFGEALIGLFGEIELMTTGARGGGGEARIGKHGMAGIGGCRPCAHHPMILDVTGGAGNADGNGFGVGLARGVGFGGVTAATEGQRLNGIGFEKYRIAECLAVQRGSPLGGDLSVTMLARGSSGNAAETLNECGVAGAADMRSVGARRRTGQGGKGMSGAKWMGGGPSRGEGGRRCAGSQQQESKRARHAV